MTAMIDQSPARPETFQAVRNLILETVHLQHLDSNTLSQQTTLGKGGLELDSVEILEVVVAIEQTFKVKVPSADAGKQHFQTLGSIASFVDSTRPN